MSKWLWYSEEEKLSWGFEHKKCRSCLLVLPFSEFHKTKQCLFGLASDCKKCRKKESRVQYKKISNEKLIFNTAKSRATKYNIPFNIDIEDVIIPDFCPALGIKIIKVGKKITDNSPTLDRIVPSLGYIKGNIVVISNKANRIKSNATSDEIGLVYKWLIDLKSGII